MPNSQQIVFFERNGLRHGEFLIRDSGKITRLVWSPDSDVLAVVIETQTEELVQLWHSSNYYWSLKKEFRFSRKDEILDLLWDPQSSLSFKVITKGLY